MVVTVGAGDSIWGVEGANCGGATPKMLAYAVRTLGQFPRTLLRRIDSGGRVVLRDVSGSGINSLGRSSLENQDRMMDSPCDLSIVHLVKILVSIALFLGERNTVNVTTFLFKQSIL